MKSKGSFWGVLAMALAALVSFGLLLSFAGCGGGSQVSSAVSSEPEVKSAAEPTEEPTASPTEEPTATPEPTVGPTVTPEPTSTPEPTPVPEPTAAPEPTEPPEEFIADPVAPPAQTDASPYDYVGSTLAAFESVFGMPGSSEYNTSCQGPGLDGILHYDGFTVYTYQDEEGNESVTYVE